MSTTLSAATHKIKPGHGYWDTTRYPYGGCFRRAGADGVECTVVKDWPGKPGEVFTYAASVMNALEVIEIAAKQGILVQYLRGYECRVVAK